MRIDARHQKPLQTDAFLRRIRRKSRKPLFLAAHILDCFHSARLYLAASVLNQVGSKTIEDSFERFVEFQFPWTFRMPPLHISIGCFKHRNFRAELIEIENARLEAVVEISRVVGNLVYKIDDLRFEGRTFVRAGIPRAPEIPLPSNRGNA